MTIINLKQTSPDSKLPRINWAKIEEADNFAKMVKLYRQGKIDHDNFRRFRLQHGAYGTRMTDDYAMVRIKIPAGEIYPTQLDRKSTRLNSSHSRASRMPSSA